MILIVLGGMGGVKFAISYQSIISSRINIEKSARVCRPSWHNTITIHSTRLLVILNLFSVAVSSQFFVRPGQDLLDDALNPLPVSSIQSSDRTKSVSRAEE